jgi:hypothetical protein
MAVIEQDVVVQMGDGEVVFEEPSLRDWAIMVELTGKSLEEQADVLLPKIKSVSGLTYRDGAEVTLKTLAEKKFSARFFLHLVKAWSDEILKSFKSEGNEPTAGS